MNNAHFTVHIHILFIYFVAQVSYWKIGFTLVSFTGSYIMLMIYNRRQTGMWPHPVFDEMHDSPARWMFFLGRQLFIFTLIDFLLRGSRSFCGPQWF